MSFCQKFLDILPFRFMRGGFFLLGFCFYEGMGAVISKTLEAFDGSIKRSVMIEFGRPSENVFQVSPPSSV